VITHDTVKSVARTGAEIVPFFNGSNKYLSSVREIRKSEYGRAKSFVSRGETRWYSHYGLFRSLLEMEMALIKLPYSPIKTMVYLAHLKMTSFSRIIRRTASGYVKEVAGLLRSITIEISNAERLGACIADVLPSMRRLFAHYKICGEAARIGTMTAVATRKSPREIDMRIPVRDCMTEGRMTTRGWGACTSVEGTRVPSTGDAIERTSDSARPLGRKVV
jgi:hypothetical protein